MSRRVVLFNTSSVGYTHFVQEYSPLRAYAFMKLSSDATLSCRVRRSSDNTETDIGFVGLDLDTASLLAFVGAGDGFITRLYDQADVAVDAVMATASQQPYIVQSGVLCEKNGTPSMFAPAGNRWVDIATPQMTRTDIVIASASNFNAGVVQYATHTNSVNLGFIIGGNPAHYFGQGHYYNGTYVDSNVKTNNQSILGTEYTGDSPSRLASFFLNGTMYDENINIGANQIVNSKIGSGPWNGLVVHCQLYISFTDSKKATLSAMHDKLNDYYGAY